MSERKFKPNRPYLIHDGSKVFVPGPYDPVKRARFKWVNGLTGSGSITEAVAEGYVEDGLMHPSQLAVFRTNL
jgi:hypothetical protein